MAWSIGLRLRRRAIDLVGEDDVREHRTLHELEEPATGRMILLHDLRAGDVAGHEIRRELHAREVEVECLRHRLHEQRLRKTGNTHQERVTAGEDGRDEIVDDIALPDDSPRDLFVQGGACRRQLVEELEVAIGVARR